MKSSGQLTPRPLYPQQRDWYPLSRRVSGPQTFEKKGCEDSIIAVMRHCKMQCASGRGGGRATFTRQEYLLFFKVEEYYRSMQKHCPSKMYDGLCGAPCCVQSSVIMEQQHSTLFCCGMNPEEGEHSGLLVLEYGSQSSLLSPLVRCAQE
jgi:hypothetical protein